MLNNGHRHLYKSRWQCVEKKGNSREDVMGDSHGQIRMKHNDKYVWSILEAYILYTNKSNKDVEDIEENRPRVWIYISPQKIHICPIAEDKSLNIFVSYHSTQNSNPATYTLSPLAW